MSDSTELRQSVTLISFLRSLFSTALDEISADFPARSQITQKSPVRSSPIIRVYDLVPTGQNNIVLIFCALYDLEIPQRSSQRSPLLRDTILHSFVIVLASMIE